MHRFPIRLSIIISVLLTVSHVSAAQQFPAKADTVSIFELDQYLALHSGNLKIALKDMQHFAVEKNGKTEYFGYDKYVQIFQKYDGLSIDLEVLPNGKNLNYFQLKNSQSVTRLRLGEGIEFADISGCPNLQLIRIPRSLRVMKGIFSQADAIELSSGDFRIVPYIKTETVANNETPANISNRFRTPWGSIIADSEQIIPLDALWGCGRLAESGETNTGTFLGQRFFYCDSTSRDIIFPDTMTYLPLTLPTREKRLNQLIFPPKVKYLPSSLLAFSCIKKLRLPQHAGRIMEKWDENWSFMGPYSEALRDCESIRLPEGIEYIPNSMLMGCRNLKSVTIPKSVKRIGNHAFAGCESLTEIVLPEGLEEIGDYAFEGCSSLKQINIPDEVISFGKGIFWACKSLLAKPQNNFVMVDGLEFDYYGTDLVLQNMEEIEKQQFWGFTSLKSVFIKKKVNTICGGAFTGCTSLESISLIDNMYINSKIDDNKSHRESPFSYCHQLKKIDMPANTIIDNHVLDCVNGDTELILRQNKYLGAYYGIFSIKDEDVEFRTRLNPKSTIYVRPEYVDQYKREMQECNRRHKTNYQYNFLPIPE